MDQWSKTQKTNAPTYTITCRFPISMSVIRNPISVTYLSNTNRDSSSRLSIHTITNTSFIFQTDTSDITTQALWIAIGR